MVSDRAMAKHTDMNALDKACMHEISCLVHDKSDWMMCQEGCPPR